MEYLVFDDIIDDSEQKLLPYFTQSNKYIHDTISANESNRVLVHCLAGVSRSSSFICAYMIEHARMKLDDIVEKVQKERP